MIIGTMAAVAAGCCNECGKVPRKPVQNVKFIELDPGHFHAALVLNRSYEGVSKDVRVFAPKGPDVEAHQKLVTAFTTREKDPTAWNEIVYTGDDFVIGITPKLGAIVHEDGTIDENINNALNNLLEDWTNNKKAFFDSSNYSAI